MSAPGAVPRELADVAHASHELLAGVAALAERVEPGDAWAALRLAHDLIDRAARCIDDAINRLEPNRLDPKEKKC